MHTMWADVVVQCVNSKGDCLAASRLRDRDGSWPLSVLWTEQLRDMIDHVRESAPRGTVRIVIDVAV